MRIDCDANATAGPAQLQLRPARHFQSCQDNSACTRDRACQARRTTQDMTARWPISDPCGRLAIPDLYVRSNGLREKRAGLAVNDPGVVIGEVEPTRPLAVRANSSDALARTAAPPSTG